MIIANLIGFGMGQDSLIEILLNMLKMTSVVNFLKLLIFFVPLVVVMFYVRKKESEAEIKKF